MARFKKEIVTAGEYDQWDRDGKPYVKNITVKDLEKMKASYDKMQSKGLKVPAPWKHDKKINAFDSNTTGGFLDDSSKNGGFWDTLQVEVIEGKTKLTGFIEAPGDVNDPNTPAGKISTTVRDTSIYVRDKMPLTDGSGESIENALMHIALVTHPIEAGQKNFELVEDGYSISMSQYREAVQESDIDDLADSSNIAELTTELRKCLKIFLPVGTTLKNLVPNLLASIKQYEMLNENESQNDSNIVKVDPIIMNQAQIDSIIKSGAVNPETGKVYAKEDFKASVSDTTHNEVLMSVMQTEMQSDRRKTFKSRINSLVATGRTTKAFADSNLHPKADSYEIQIADGKMVEAPLEMILMSLEAMESTKTVVTADQIVMGPSGDNTQYSEEDLDKQADYMARLINS
jgi:hypothetical protein